MLKQTMEAEVRSGRGKGVARKLRGVGRIPAVLYGPRTEPVALDIDGHTLNRILFKAKGERVLFTLELKGNGDGGQRLALIKELQLHPVNDSIRHVDFYEVAMDQPVTVDVPVSLTGKAKGVEIDKGILEVLQRSLNVSCLPSDIPTALEVDVSDLGLGEAIHVSDVTPPAGVTLLDDPKMPIVTIVGASAAAAEAGEEEEEEEVEEVEEQS